MGLQLKLGATLWRCYRHHSWCDKWIIMDTGTGGSQKSSVVTVLDRQNLVRFGRYYGEKPRFRFRVSVLRSVIEQLKLLYKFYNNGAYLLPLPAVKIRGLTLTQILRSAHLWWFVRRGRRRLGVKLTQSLCCRTACADPTHLIVSYVISPSPAVVVRLAGGCILFSESTSILQPLSRINL